jgi:hypothetical protein
MGQAEARRLALTISHILRQAQAREPGAFGSRSVRLTFLFTALFARHPISLHNGLCETPFGNFEILDNYIGMGGLLGKPNEFLRFDQIVH